MGRLGSPGQPLPVSSPACSKSSRSTPPLRDLLRQFLVSTLTCSRWTGTPWMPARILSSGEFEVVKELVATLKDGVAAKNECDKVIDKNGTPKTGGTGIKQLRENIAESKLSYEIMDDAAQ